MSPCNASILPSFLWLSLTPVLLFCSCAFYRGIMDQLFRLAQAIRSAHTTRTRRVFALRHSTISWTALLQAVQWISCSMNYNKARTNHVTVYITLRTWEVQKHDVFVS